jgi:Cu/Ag efflux pump CusA
MTLGGIAVAMGELVDDAIVDVENIFRRLKENNAAANPKPRWWSCTKRARKSAARSSSARRW